MNKQQLLTYLTINNLSHVYHNFLEEFLSEVQLTVASRTDVDFVPLSEAQNFWSLHSAHWRRHFSAEPPVSVYWMDMNHETDEIALREILGLRRVQQSRSSVPFWVLHLEPRVYSEDDTGAPYKEHGFSVYAATVNAALYVNPTGPIKEVLVRQQFSFPPDSTKPAPPDDLLKFWNNDQGSSIPDSVRELRVILSYMGWDFN